MLWGNLVLEVLYRWIISISDSKYNNKDWLSYNVFDRNTGMNLPWYQKSGWLLGPPVSPSSSDSMLEGSGLFEPTSDAHVTSDPVVHVINIWPRRNNSNKIPRHKHRICSRTCQRRCEPTLTLFMCGEVLAIAAYNVRTLMDITSQAITIHTLS